ncbi:hypothetical protein C8R42DRAFT_152528 [Lentinula raphanica]|nr:hypothetical protein C8R42DRAFT_152528 [Lentinula raphanica]
MNSCTCYNLNVHFLNTFVHFASSKKHGFSSSSWEGRVREEGHRRESNPGPRYGAGRWALGPGRCLCATVPSFLHSRSAYFPSSQSIGQIAWPSERISTRLCDKCNHLIYLDAPLLDFHTILERSRSGYNPTPSDRKAYLGMLDEARYEIERRETDLRRLQEMIPRLEEQIQLLQAYEAGIKHIISPIQSLPLEILGVIFQYVCCGKDATDIANWCRFGSKNRLPTYDVSRVCIRWNKFVTSMPLLWTSFGSSSSNSVSDAFVQTFIERSRSNLIDFNLSNHTSSRKYTPSPLVAHYNRWCHVSIAGSASVIMNSFLLPLVNKEPLSNLLSLRLDHCNRPRQLVQLPIIFPSLKLLVIRGLSVILGVLTIRSPPSAFQE